MLCTCNIYKNTIVEGVLPNIQSISFLLLLYREQSRMYLPQQFNNIVPFISTCPLLVQRHQRVTYLFDKNLTNFSLTFLAQMLLFYKHSDVSFEIIIWRGAFPENLQQQKRRLCERTRYGDIEPYSRCRTLYALPCDTPFQVDTMFEALIANALTFKHYCIADHKRQQECWENAWAASWAHRA